MNYVTIEKAFMEVTEAQTIESASRNAGEEYLKIIHLDHLPKSPEDMPDRVFLPPEALGSLEQAILDTSSDAKERDQIIDYNKGKGFVPGKVSIGNNDSINSWAALHHEWKAFLGRKGLAFFHTHPGVIPFSPEDIAFQSGNRRLAFINLLGTKSRVMATFQTEKSARLPISASVANSETYQRINSLVQKQLLEVRMNLDGRLLNLVESLRGQGSSTSPLKEEIARRKQEYAEALEYEGLAYYEWISPGGEVKPGDLQKGLELTRVLGNKIAK